MRSCPCDRGGSTEAGEATISQNISFPGKPSSIKGGDRGWGVSVQSLFPDTGLSRRLSSQEVFSLERSVEKASYCYCSLSAVLRYCSLSAVLRYCAPCLLCSATAPCLLCSATAPCLLLCFATVLHVCCAPLLLQLSSVLH